MTAAVAMYAPQDAWAGVAVLHHRSYLTRTRNSSRPAWRRHGSRYNDRLKAMNRNTPDATVGALERDPTAGVDFIRAMIAEDVAAGRHGGRVTTRFPPEPNGYLHIGHAKSICLNFGVAAEFGGTCNLRFDDTNPTKEDLEYARAISDDVQWLGFVWSGEPRYASDYFEQLYEYAVHLIADGHAYVDSLPSDEIRRLRGTLTEPGMDSPYRER